MIHNKILHLTFLLALFLIFTALDSEVRGNDLTDISFSPKGNMFLARYSGKVELRETQTGKILQTFGRRTKDSAETSFRYAAFTPDEKTVLLISENNKMSWRDILTGKPINEIQFAASSPFAISPDATRLTNLTVSAKNKEVVNLYDSRDGKLLKRFFLPQKSITCLSFFPDNKQLLVVGSIETLIISIKDGRIIKRVRNPIVCLSCAAAADGDSVLLSASLGASFVAGENEKVRIFSLRNKKSYLGLDKKYAALMSKSNVVGYSPTNLDTAFVAGDAIVSKKGILFVWDIKSGKTKKLIANERSILAASFSPDGKNILLLDIAGDLVLIDVETGVIIRRYTNEKVKEEIT